ncbi:MAG: thioester domain-containing protein, partial [Acidimicrobiia bacterium]
MGFVLLGAGMLTGGLGFLGGEAKADGVTATFTGLGASQSVTLTRSGQSVQPTAAQLLFKVGDQTFSTYCIDFTHGLDTRATYVESDWTAANAGSDIAKINWILHNSFPVESDLLKLSKAAGIWTANTQVTLTAAQAAAGTQAAIWHFSDQTDLAGDSNDPGVAKLYAYLIDPANNTGLDSTPRATLSLAPDAISGHAGEELGPFTVETTSSELAVAVAGNSSLQVLVNGAPSNVAHNGDVISVKVPPGEPAGKAELIVSGGAPLRTGRVFVRKGAPTGAQKQILAAGGLASVKELGMLSWDGAVTSAAADQSCAAGGMVVTLTNSGTVPTTFSVNEGNLGFSTTGIEVAAGKVEQIVVPMPSGTRYDIEVSAGAWSTHLVGTYECTAST